jgi:hypothetical protein
MMAKPLATIFALTLIGNLRAEDPVPATSVISWKGSAFKDGDAFNVTATIGGKEVRLVWDGFAAPEFDFMDDRENPKVLREYIVRDGPTVKAFGIISSSAEQCDAGLFGPIGQGVMIDSTVQSPPGKVRLNLSYFGTPLHKTKAQRFGQIPWDLKKFLVDPQAAKEVASASKFSGTLRSLAVELEAYGLAFKALSEASKTNQDLPVAALGSVFEPTSLNRYLEVNQDTPQASEAIRESLPIFESVLAACLAPEHRSSLCGEDAGEGGVILFIDTCHGLESQSFPLLKMAVRVPDCPVSLLSYEGRAFLLHFAVGWRSREGLDITDPCQLVLSDEGKLGIRQGEEDFGASPQALDRMEYLDRKNLRGVLLGLKAPPENRVAMVTISSISLNPDNREHAKIDFFLDGIERVLEVKKAGEKWKPGKLWNKGDYYLIDNVYHNDTDFRPEGP